MRQLHLETFILSQSFACLANSISVVGVADVGVVLIFRGIAHTKFAISVLDFGMFGAVFLLG